MPEPACRHTGAPWGRRDIHLPPCWTRAVQAYLPSHDYVAARSLFRQCRLMLALRGRIKSRSPTSPTSEHDHSEETGIASGSTSLGQACTRLFWVLLVKLFLPVSWLRYFTSTQVFLSWQKSIAMHKPTLKTQRSTDRPLRHVFNHCRNPEEPQHQISKS